MRVLVWLQFRPVVGLTVLLLCGSAVTPSVISAVEKCKIKVDGKNGTILVGASGIVGGLRWGSQAGQETNPFSNADTCIVAGKAKNCVLGTLGSPERIIAPGLCTLYLADDSANICAVFIKSCTPGIHTASEALNALKSVDGEGPAWTLIP